MVHKMETSIHENYLVEFIMVDDILERDFHLETDEFEDDYFISLQMFEHLYQNWCKTRGRKIIDMSDKTNLRNIFWRTGLIVRFKKQKVDNVMCEDYWILGVRRRQPTFECKTFCE